MHILSMLKTYWCVFHRTETIGEQLQTFEAEAMVLKTWMSTAKMKLDDLKHLSKEDMQNIGNIRTKVEHILVSSHRQMSQMILLIFYAVFIYHCLAFFPTLIVVVVACLVWCSVIVR